MLHFDWAGISTHDCKLPVQGWHSTGMETGADNLRECAHAVLLGPNGYNPCPLISGAHVEYGPLHDLAAEGKLNASTSNRQVGGNIQILGHAAPPLLHAHTGTYACGNLTQLQTQNEKILNLTQKRLKQDFFSFVKRLKSDQKVIFRAPSHFWVTFVVKKSPFSHFLVTFESLYRKRKSLFLSQIHYFPILGL